MLLVSSFNRHQEIEPLGMLVTILCKVGLLVADRVPVLVNHQWHGLPEISPEVIHFRLVPCPVGIWLYMLSYFCYVLFICVLVFVSYGREDLKVMGGMARELQAECSHHGHILALYVRCRGDFVVVGDLMKSVSLLMYKVSVQPSSSRESGHYKRKLRPLLSLAFTCSFVR